MNVPSIVHTQDGHWTWQVNNPELQERQKLELIAQGPLYGSYDEAVAGFFAVIFGIYDNDPFIELYGKWQASLPKDQRLSAASPGPNG